MMREASLPRETAKNLTIKVPSAPDGPRAREMLLADWSRTGQTLA
jgi:hypothetical protein